MRRAAFGVYLAAAAALFGPWLAERREVVEGTPAHPPLYQRVPVELRAGAEICVAPITLTQRTERVRFGTMSAEAAPIAVTARGPGYESSTVVRAGALAVHTAVDPPPRDLEGEVCFANRGERPVQLLGTSDPRILGRADPTVDGQRVSTTEVSVTLLRARRESIAARLGDAFAHADVVAPGFVAPWMLWLLAPLVALGIPAGALAAAAKAEDREEERREEDLQPDDQ